MTAAASQTGIPIPPLFDLEPTLKETLIGSIKLVLQRAKQEGLVSGDPEYGDLLRDPAAMHAFIEAYRSHPKLGRGLALDAFGQPVEALDTPLVCGVSLGQVERMLVYTCAKKAYVRQKGDKPPEEIRAHVAFGWQLPLIEAYRRELTPDHLKALGELLLLLPDAAAVETVGALDSARVWKAREVAGARMAEALRAAGPAVISGLAAAEPQTVTFFESLAGSRVWEVFAGGDQLVMELRGRSPGRLQALGPNMADLSVGTLRLLDDLSEAILTPFMEAFRRLLGEAGGPLLHDQDFAREFLRDIVSQFRALERDTPDKMEGIGSIVDLKLAALEPKIRSWMDSHQGKLSREAEQQRLIAEARARQEGAGQEDE